MSAKTISREETGALTSAGAQPTPPVPPLFGMGMGSASGLDRQSAKVSFSALSARVASAARRVQAHLDLDGQEKQTLAQVHEVLVREANALRQPPSGRRAPDSYASYSFAQIAHSALGSSRRAKKSNVKDAAAGLEKLAEDLHAVLTGVNGEAQLAAARVSEVFSKASRMLLAQVGSPGDSLRGSRRQ